MEGCLTIRDDQRQYWDKAAASKTFTHTLEIERLAPYLSKEAKILDFGCGYGRICDALYHRGYKNVVGVDSSEKMIERGLKDYPYLDLLAIDSDLSALERYDVIILFAVLTCIPSDEAQMSLMAQLYERLKTNGIVYISDYWLQRDDRNLKRYHKFSEKNGTFGVFELPDGAIVRHHSRAWIEGLVSRFESEAFYDCELTSMNGNPSSCFQFIGRKNNV
jgi:SAM-dependent methyltransferase